jgi:ABC-type antimicrobial peptide transport system permease subunit
MNKSSNKRKSHFRLFIQRFSRNKLAVFGLIFIVIIILAALLAPYIAPYGYDDQDVSRRLTKPNSEHWFGTDDLGRDVFSRMIYGARVSLSIGISTTTISMFTALIIGMISGYYGGKVDNIIMRIVDIFLAIPSILLSIAIAATLGGGIVSMLIAISLGAVPGVSRLIRAQVMAESHKEYIEAAKVTRPRWARSSRKGIINVKYSVLFEAEDIRNMTIDEINKKISDGIYMNEYEWQKENMVRFKGKNLAEYLDLFLVVCPKCKSLCTLHSHGDTFSCTKCEYTVQYNEYGYFTTQDEKYFDNPQLWSEWQNSYLHELFSKDEYKLCHMPLFDDTKAKLFTGKRRGRLRQYTWLGDVVLYFDRFEFIPEKGEHYIFPLSEITGMNIQNNNKFEFYYKDTLYRFKFNTQHKSVYKYQLGINIVRSINKSTI